MERNILLSVEDRLDRSVRPLSGLGWKEMSNFYEVFYMNSGRTSYGPEKDGPHPVDYPPDLEYFEFVSKEASHSSDHKL